MLLSWSGGCDSTLMLYDALKHAESMGNLSTVRTVAITHYAVGAENRQRTARQRIRAKLKKMGYEWKHQEMRIDLCKPYEFGARHFDDGGLSQPQIWIPNLSCFLERDEDLALGYVAGDCVWHYIEAVQQLFAGLQGIAKRTGKLVFPLEWHTKKQILGRLEALGLLNLCWYCEDWPEPKDPCGTCGPCEAHLAGRFLLERAQKSQDGKALEVKSKS